MNKREKLAFGIVAALAMTSGGIAYGQSVNNVSSDQVIYACVTGVNGNIVRVSNTRKTCPRGTTPIQWNAVGPRGEQGVPGSAVAKGDKGDKGDIGERGPEGLQGIPGISAGSTWSFYNQSKNQKLEIEYLPVGTNPYPVQFVKAEGNYWRASSSGRLYPLEAEPIAGRSDSVIFLHSELDCQGKTYGITSDGLYLENLVYRHGNTTFTISPTAQSNFGSVKSIRKWNNEEEFPSSCVNGANLVEVRTFLQQIKALNIPEQIRLDDKEIDSSNGFYEDRKFNIFSCTWHVRWNLGFEGSEVLQKDYLEGVSCPQISEGARLVINSSKNWVDGLVELNDVAVPGIDLSEGWQIVRD